MFVLGSFAVHGVAYAALQGVNLQRDALYPPTVELEVALENPPLPDALPEPLPAAPPAPPAVVSPRVVNKPVRQELAQVPHTAEAPVPIAEPPPPLQALGVSVDDGLAVAGQAGIGGTGPGSLTGSLDGVIGGSGGAPAPAPAPAIDLRKLTSEWASRVSLAIGTRAVHEYPRSALRAHVEGTVLLTVRIGIHGEIQTVELARSSGFPQLDEAALSAARELGAVPAPPAALHRYLRPFPVPVNYVIRS